MPMVRLFSALFAVVAFTIPAIAGEIAVTNAWTRAMLPGAEVAGGFVTITNSGRTDDRLIAVSSPLAAKAELHSMDLVDDVMTMRPIEGGLAIAAGSKIELKPGGNHLMLMGMDTPLKEGERAEVTLTFEGAGDISVELMVMKADTKNMDHSGHGHDHNHDNDG